MALLWQLLMSISSDPALTLVFAPKTALLSKSLLPTKTQAADIALPLLCSVFSSCSQSVAFIIAFLSVAGKSCANTIIQRKHYFLIFQKGNLGNAGGAEQVGEWTTGIQASV